MNAEIYDTSDGKRQEQHNITARTPPTALTAGRYRSLLSPCSKMFQYFTWS